MIPYMKLVAERIKTGKREHSNREKEPERAYHPVSGVYESLCVPGSIREKRKEKLMSSQEVSREQK